MEEKGNFYDTARFAAVLLVVWAHVTRMYTGLGVVDPVMPSKGLAWLTKVIYAFHMPLFIFLSGAVFGMCLENGKYQDRVRFLLRKAKRLVLPYAVFGLCYVAPTMVLLHFTEQGYWEYVWDGIVLSHNSRHLWYVMALFLIFCLAILCRDLWEKMAWAVLLCSVCLYFGAGWLPGEFQVRAAASYQVYFFLGMLWNKYFGKVMFFLQRFWAAPVLSVLVFGAVYGNCQGGSPWEKFACAAAGIAMALSLCGCMERKGLAKSMIVKRVNKNSYGIYFFHPMIIYILFWETYRDRISPVVLSAGIFLLAFFVSYVLTEAVRAAHLGIIIGEG